MPLNPKYCTQCAHPVETKQVDDRVRTICPSCITVFYENPLPVAAAVVLNENREVLLVKRKNEPRRGLWCLPIGFAELGETIAAAALRELYEEAGIGGRVLRLLTASSMVVETYGDLLAVTFEVSRTSGVERAGDDAEEIGYFNRNDLPPLAFEANKEAIDTCHALHEEEWAITDSFHNLEEPEDGHHVMLSDSLAQFIRERAGKLAETWHEEICRNRLTPSYRIVDPRYLRARIQVSLEHVASWLTNPTTGPAVQEFYRAMGEEHRYMGFGLHEVITALGELRSIILAHAHRESAGDRPIDAYRLLELDRRVMLFFDDAVHHTTRGFAGE